MLPNSLIKSSDPHLLQSRLSEELYAYMDSEFTRDLAPAGVSKSFHTYSRASIGLLASSLLAMSLIPMDPTQIDHHASYHSPLHPLRAPSLQVYDRQTPPTLTSDPFILFLLCRSLTRKNTEECLNQPTKNQEPYSLLVDKPCPIWPMKGKKNSIVDYFGKDRLSFVRYCHAIQARSISGALLLFISRSTWTY